MLLRWLMFESFYLLKITGRDPKSFLTKLIALKIELRKVVVSKNDLQILVNEDDYQKIIDMKTIYQIEVLNRYGFAKFRYLFHKYFLFLASVFVSILLLQFLSHLILKVEVIHTKEEIRTLILNDLEDYGIRPYRFKVSFAKKEKIVEQILEKEKDHLEWIEIEEVGTSYRVSVEERKKMGKMDFKEEQSIVAKKPGRILEIEASHGEIVKAKNDYVQKGDVLISGIIKNKDKPVSKIRAEGRVFAEVWYQVRVEVPYQYKEEVLTGRDKKRLELSFLNYHFPIIDLKPYKQSRKKRSVLLQNNLLPISLSYTTYQEVKVLEEIHSEKEALEKAYQISVSKLRSRLQKEDEIISQKTLKKSHKNSKIVVEVFFKVKENITDTVSLKDVKLEELQKEAEEGSE